MKILGGRLLRLKIGGKKALRTPMASTNQTILGKEHSAEDTVQGKRGKNKLTQADVNPDDSESDDEDCESNASTAGPFLLFH